MQYPAADFDRIATLSERDGVLDVPSRNMRELEQLLPARAGTAIDVGCGRGSFTSDRPTGHRGEGDRPVARNDEYQTLAEVRDLYGRILPGARLVGHLRWRYTAVWHRPRDRG